MKKIAASFTILVYLAFTCGVMVTYHYCMDRFDSCRLYKPAGDWCSTCGMHTNGKKCCHDQVTIIKIQDDHQSSSVTPSIQKLKPAAASVSEFLTFVLFNEYNTLHKVDHSPPLALSERGIYIQNSVFRI